MKSSTDLSGPNGGASRTLQHYKSLCMPNFDGCTINRFVSSLLHAEITINGVSFSNSLTGKQKVKS